MFISTSTLYIYDILPSFLGYFTEKYTGIYISSHSLITISSYILIAFPSQDQNSQNGIQNEHLSIEGFFLE